MGAQAVHTITLAEADTLPEHLRLKLRNLISHTDPEEES